METVKDEKWNGVSHEKGGMGCSLSGGATPGLARSNDLAGRSTAMANDLARRSTSLAPPCDLPIALLRSVNRKYK